MQLTTYKDLHFTPYHKQNGIISKLKSILQRSPPMAEEKKESKAERVMLTMSSKLKEKIETEADKLGINTTQYIINLIVNDLKK